MFTWTAGQAQEQVCPPPPHCKSRERTTCRPWCPSCSRPPSSARPPRCPHRRPGSPRPSRCRRELLPSPLRCYFRSIAPHLNKTLVWFQIIMQSKYFTWTAFITSLTVSLTQASSQGQTLNAPGGDQNTIPWHQMSLAQPIANLVLNGQVTLYIHTSHPASSHHSLNSSCFQPSQGFSGEINDRKNLSISNFHTSKSSGRSINPFKYPHKKLP